MMESTSQKRFAWIAWSLALSVGLSWTPAAVAQQQWLVRQSPERPLTKALSEHKSDLRLIQEFRHVPWSVVQGSEEEVRALLQAGEISDFEADQPRRLMRGGASMQAGLPWPLLVVPLLGLAACGDDGEETEPLLPGSPVQTTSWGWSKIRADQAQNTTRGAGVKVVVIDTGIDSEHPDLNVVGGENFVFGSPGVSTPWDDCDGHGSHVAGILAAQDNELGVVGVAPEVELYAARVFGCNEEFTSVARVVAALDWSIEIGAQVANLSLGSENTSNAEREGIERAVAAGIVIVAASGNESAQAASFPAGYDGVIGVGATDESDSLADFSNRGAAVDVSAPGVGILSSLIVGSSLQAEVRRGTDSLVASPLEFSGQGNLTKDYFFCGLALSSSDCPSDVDGEIALIERGENFFSEKVENAMAAGAVGVIIFNHNEEGGGLFNGTLGEAGNWIPVVSIDRSNGQNLLERGDGTSVALKVEGSDYGLLSGTSMASPHAAGLAALILAQDPSLSPTQVAARMQESAVDLGSPGRDNSFGSGRIDVAGALGLSSGSAASHQSEPASPSERTVGFLSPRDNHCSPTKLR